MNLAKKRVTRLFGVIGALAFFLGLSGCGHLPGGEQATKAAIAGGATDAVAAKPIVLWSEPESRIRLERARAKGDFFQLASYYEPQANKFFCGPATAVILLNTFGLKDPAMAKPSDRRALPWDKDYFNGSFDPIFSKFTQSSFLNDRTDRVKPRSVFFGEPLPNGRRDGGLKLEQFAELLKVYGLKTTVSHVESLGGIAELKARLIASLEDATSFAVVNFDRSALPNGKGGGHISPIAAYDEITDSFLVLDVNPVASEWFWVSAPALFAAMNTKDGDLYRGFVIVSK